LCREVRRDATADDANQDSCVKEFMAENFWVWRLNYEARASMSVICPWLRVGALFEIVDQVRKSRRRAGAM
jgi:hypothetical protein